MTGTDQDALRAYTQALTPAARHALGGLDNDTIRWIHAATERIGTAELARICSKGIHHGTTNARGLIRYRLRREARLDLEEEGT